MVDVDLLEINKKKSFAYFIQKQLNQKNNFNALLCIIIYIMIHIEN